MRALDFALILGDFQPDRWQIKHLPFFVTHHRLIQERATSALATWAVIQLMDHGKVRLLGRLQRITPVSWLTASVTTAFGSEALGSGRFYQPIASRWLVTVATVFGHPLFKLQNPGFEADDPFPQDPVLLLQSQHQIHQRFRCGFCQFKQLLPRKLRKRFIACGLSRRGHLRIIPDENPVRRKQKLASSSQRPE